jgi:hypothetical protein
VIAASFAAIAAVGSGVTALMSYRRERQWTHADTFLRIVERLDSDTSRRRRSLVNYGLPARHQDWDGPQREEVRTLCADLDVVGVLLYKHRDLRPFLEMYGDTVVRSIWIAAPYANDERERRGDKFLLCLSRLAARLVDQWRVLAERGELPGEFRFPPPEPQQGASESELRKGRDTVQALTPDEFERDEDVRNFLAVAARFETLERTRRLGRWLRRRARPPQTNVATRDGRHLHADCHGVQSK